MFKDIKGHSGSYQISSCGTVKGLDRIGTDGRRLKGKVIQGRLDKDGYLSVILRKDGKSIQHKVHRLVCGAFKGYSDLQVNHINRDKQDNRIENLEWVTSKQNNTHAHAKTATVVCPAGKLYTFTNIADFCKDHGLTKQLLGRVLLGRRSHHKGWKAL
jgi:hypothetical protein